MSDVDDTLPAALRMIAISTLEVAFFLEVEKLEDIIYYIGGAHMLKFQKKVELTLLVQYCTMLLTKDFTVHTHNSYKGCPHWEYLVR